ncbi:MAG: hypothetical protein HC874_30615 [Richelia sp. SL_2_1]|nr:hypothetical protein [Richelia sp. SM1_7_0]NJO31424.1 hypothetical protein [Richelia sp. SL_2_1]
MVSSTFPHLHNAQAIGCGNLKFIDSRFIAAMSTPQIHPVQIAYIIGEYKPYRWGVEMKDEIYT